jgi:hypothetical protein
MGSTFNFLEPPDNRTDQTTFGILSNYFDTYPWTMDEVMIDANDKNEVIPNLNKEKYNLLYARYYVFTKTWLFWRDYLFFLTHGNFRKNESFMDY